MARSQALLGNAIASQALLGGMKARQGISQSLDFENISCNPCYYASMKITFDPRYNIAYIRLQEKGAEVEIIRISDELNVK